MFTSDRFGDGLCDLFREWGAEPDCVHWGTGHFEPEEVAP
jgi:hypothetical protein